MKSNREISLDWYRKLSTEQQKELILKHKPLGWEFRQPLDLTGREVEILFNLENNK